MDFTLGEERQAAAEAARAAFADVAPGSGVPSPEVGTEPIADGIDRELWQRLTTSDLPGIALDEQYGGSGLDPVAWCLVLRESARVLARVPLLETGAAALAVQRYGSEEQRLRLLPEAAAGRLLLGVAPVAADLATAKVWSAEGVRGIASTAQHLHGGIGADLDYPLHRYHAWATYLELFLGPAPAFEEELGATLAEHQL